MKTWYSNYEELLISATEHLVGAIQRAKGSDKSIQTFFLEYKKETFAKFIFESNKIENEGLSEGETKKLVLAEFNNKVKIPLLGDLKKAKLDVYKINRKENEVELPKLGISVKYENSERDFYAVVGHLIGIYISDARALRVGAEKYHESSKYFKKNIGTDDLRTYMSWPDYYQLLLAYRLNKKRTYYLTEPLIKLLHKKMTVGSKNNANGKPGEFRPNPAYINDETIFLEPGLIKLAVKRMIASHRNRISNEFYNPIIEACRIKEEFIKIHPFGDFNGRISRLILAGFLQSEAFPINLVLKSNSKDKSRYLLSMKHAFRGNPFTLIAFVSKAIIEQIDSINNRLEIAGLAKIVPIPLGQDEVSMIRNSLDSYRHECRNMKV